MGEMNCTNEDKYTSKDGRCCDRCPAGSYRKAECDITKGTECAKCEHGFYTATKNHLTNCHVCRDCSPSNNQRKINDCTANKDTECECVTGFYCSNENCDHCRPVTLCTLGEGVKVRATRTNDTICAPCEEGTYSNVTDFHSPCQTHTRCEDIGRLLKTPGTRTTDVLCGDFKTHCHWILPAGLWSGLVLTALVLFGLFCWWEKRKSYKTASSIVPVTLVEMIPAVPDSPLDLPLPSIERNGYCQESCTVDGCELTLFKPGFDSGDLGGQEGREVPGWTQARDMVDHGAFGPKPWMHPKMFSDDNVVRGSTQDSMDNCLPITPLKASMSFSESSHRNGSAGYCTSNFLRIYSEPQEDEWCGT